MSGTKQIRKALCKIMPETEANACEIGKSWDPAGQGFGWWYRPFGKTAQLLGTSIPEALETIEDWHIQAFRDALTP